MSDIKMEKNVGFIGFMGKVHACSHINLPIYYESLPFKPVLSHVCTARPETARAGADLIGAPHAVTDYRQITENPDINMVHICTPHHLHKEAILSAMAQGVYIQRLMEACRQPAESGSWVTL